MRAEAKGHKTYSILSVQQIIYKKGR